VSGSQDFAWSSVQLSRYCVELELREAARSSSTLNLSAAVPGRNSTNATA